MVENSRKALCPDAGLRCVNLPEPIHVEEDTLSLPIAIKIKRREVVTDIIDRWRLDDEWWRTKPISRLYYVVILASGQRLVLYKDIIAGGWFRGNM